MSRVGKVFVLNVFKQRTGKLSRRRTLTDCDSLNDLNAVLKKLLGMFEKAMAVRGKNGSGASFRNARNESLNLKNINLRAVCAQNNLKSEAAACFEVLRVVMRMHACLEFNCEELSGTTALLGREAGYNLGGRVLSLADVTDIAALGVSPFGLGVDMPKEY
jgi:hypothetical protein